MPIDFQNIVETVNNALKKYKSLDGIELEGRLGLYNQETKTFDPDIGEENFDIIKELLNSCTEWNTVKIGQNTTDIFHTKLRLSIDNDTKKEICINKKKLESFTFITDNLPFDLRITISKEDKIDNKKFPLKRTNLMSRNKERDSYTLIENTTKDKVSQYQFDITKVLNYVPDSTSVEVTFEYEIEYIGDISDEEENKNTIYSIVLKLLDGMYACNDNKFIKTKENTLPLDMASMSLLE